jgi:Coenzyme PQQ synthesis protein D (PqqD)
MNKKLYVARSPRIAARKLGQEMLVMSGQGSTLFTLNPTATVLWQAADGATPLDEIVEHRICSEFEVNSEEALRDAEALAEDLAKHGILLVSEQPIPEQPSSEQPSSEQPISEQPAAKSGAPLQEQQSQELRR